MMPSLKKIPLSHLLLEDLGQALHHGINGLSRRDLTSKTRRYLDLGQTPMRNVPWEIEIFLMNSGGSFKLLVTKRRLKLLLLPGRIQTPSNGGTA
jgi:hypothetical protein